ncbi:PAS domain S-box protein [Lutibacter sp.]|uniref:PAS domain S-box protein n=1 Tax=Lutibacter sp. TaxID=1925666 RepID=UPI0025B98C3B|nr:PAS domain S-box protein [Lutibacter sp.]MCF6181616.1 PAS domain S-box protein [Lutibacter sp.]
MVDSIKYKYDTSKLLFVEIDKNGIVTYVNTKTCEVLNYTEDEIIGKNWFENFIPVNTKAKTLEVSKKLLTNNYKIVTSHENKVLTKNGKELVIHWHNTPIFDDDFNITGHLSSGINYTKKLELTKNLDRANKIIERSSSLAILWKKAPHWPVEFISKNVAQILGYSENDFLSRTVLYENIIHPEDIKRVSSEVAYFEEKLLKKFTHKPYRLICKDGTVKWFHDETNIIVSNDGETTHYDGVLTDITKSKNAENKLKKQHKMMETILAAFDDGVYMSDENYNISYLNKGMIKKIGYNAIGDKCHKAIHNLEQPCSWCYFNDLKEFGKSNSIEVKLKDNYYIVTSVLLENNSKMTVYHDITKTKKLKKQLQLKNKELTAINENLTLEKEKFKDIVENTGEWIWEVDLNGDFTYSNDLVEQISGYKANEIISKNIFHFVNKKYEEKLIENFKNYISKKQGWHNIEVKFKHKNGSLIYIQSNAVAIINKKGIIKGFRGVNLDITRRKLEEKEKEKLLIAVEQSANTIVITDSKGNIEYTNPKFTKITGYTAKEALGKNPRILKSGKQPDQYYASMWKTISSGKTWHGEFLNKAKNDNLFWEQVTITPIKNKNNKITNYIAIKEDITLQKKARLELSKSFDKLKVNETYLSNILQTADEGFWVIDNNAYTVDLNTKMCRILGLPKYKIIGKSIYEFVNEQNTTIFKEQIKLRTFGKSSSYEIELTTNKGKQIPCFFRTSPLFDKQQNKKGSFAFVTDISIIKKTYKILENKNLKLNELSTQLSEKNRLLFENTQRFKNLFDKNPIALWEEDFSEVKKLLNKIEKKGHNIKTYLNENPDFVLKCVSKVKVINVNDAAVELFEVQSKEELLTGFGDNFTEKSLHTFKEELIDIYKNKEDIVHETDIFKKDGTIINAIMRIVQIENNRTIVSISDITEINKAKEKAEESNRLKTEFLNNMSHEIRTPMNGILGFTDLLANDDVSPEKRKNFIQIIQNSGKQLLHVIDDILEISRLGTKQVTIQKSEVNINNLMVELFSIFDIKAKETGIPIYLNKALSDKESIVLTDSLKLNKILGNLLENAYKFTNSGFIEFGYKLNNNTLDFYVKDTGIGIKPEKQESIFERFSQEEKELSKKFGGLGLGLSIAKENTELLGGKITLESVKGIGSTFTVSIPYKPVQGKNSTNIIKEKQSKKTKCTILIVEDEQVNYMFLETLLLDVLKFDCILHHAKNGQEAVDFCHSNSNIDLILMDLKMPVLNGFEATKIIKAIHPKIPIIAQTAYSTDDDKKRTFNAGCNEFISKPISKENLLEVLGKYLKI